MKSQLIPKPALIPVSGAQTSPPRRLWLTVQSGEGLRTTGLNLEILRAWEKPPDSFHQRGNSGNRTQTGGGRQTLDNGNYNFRFLFLGVFSQSQRLFPSLFSWPHWEPHTQKLAQLRLAQLRLASQPSLRGRGRAFSLLGRLTKRGLTLCHPAGWSGDNKFHGFVLLTHWASLLPSLPLPDLRNAPQAWPW